MALANGIQLLPKAISQIESIFPDKLKGVKYNLYSYEKRGLIGLNIQSENLPSSLFWIDETLDVRACFGGFRYGEEYRVFTKDFQHTLTKLLRAI